MEYSVEIANAIKKFLIEDDWNYSFDEEKGTFSMGVNLKCKLGDTKIVVRVGNDYFYSLAYIKLNANEDVRSDVAEFITRANYGRRNGNFEMDFNDGELRYKSFNNCDGIVPSAEIIKDSLIIPALMIDRYGDGLVSVLFGMQSPKDAIDAIENN